MNGCRRSQRRVQLLIWRVDGEDGVENILALPTIPEQPFLQLGYHPGGESPLVHLSLRLPPGG
jgi:hypothetical protein